MSQPTSRTDGFPMAVMVEGAVALVGIVAAWLFSVPVRDQIPSEGQPLLSAVLRGLIATLPMLILFWWLVHSNWPTLRELRAQVVRLINAMFPQASLGQLALVSLLAGVGEELLFRGVIQTVIGWWIPPVAALVLTALLFGLLHALSKIYFVLATVIGLGLGWMTWHYNDLVGPMVAHSLYDFLALLYLSRLSQNSDRATPE